ncbi:MAG: cell division protein FtsA [Lentisphaeria bacterium]|nr:cell division protein FtsA [Lentisphaeria bacterium]
MKKADSFPSIMRAKKTNTIYTGIEIGSGSIKVVMGEFDEGDIIRVAGLADVPSMRVLKGEITDNDIVHEQLVQALNRAEKMAKRDVKDVYLAINTGTMASVNSIGACPASGPNQTIAPKDVAHALSNARAYVLPPDKTEVNTIDRRLLLDGHREVVNPVHQVAKKVAADIHLMYGRYNSIENACLLVERTMGYSALDACFSIVAAAFAVLSKEDMAQGTLVVDIGAGTTNYILFHGIGVFHSGQVTVGTDHIANDLAIGLEIPMVKARGIVKTLDRFGASAVMTPDGDERPVKIAVPGMKTRTIPASVIELVAEERLKELFDIILEDLNRQSALPRMPNGVMLTGGGALIKGVDELAHRVFQLPVRAGIPRDVFCIDDVASSPAFATPIGLLRWAKFLEKIEDGEKKTVTDKILQDVTTFFGKLFGGLRNALRW